MKHISTFLLGAVLLAGCSSAQYKYGPYGSMLSDYTAELSYKDHYSANGRRLSTVGSIIKRDRENYSSAHNRDRLDRWGKFLNDSRDRDALERMINDGNISPSARHVILNDYPLVRVRIYNGGKRGDYAVVDIIDDNARKSTVRNTSTQYGENDTSKSESSTSPYGSEGCPQPKCRQ